jgi:hypothetical protein
MVATLFRAGKTAVSAEEIEQGDARVACERVLGSVYRERHLELQWTDVTRSISDGSYLPVLLANATSCSANPENQDNESFWSGWRGSPLNGQNPL